MRIGLIYPAPCICEAVQIRFAKDILIGHLFVVSTVAEIESAIEKLSPQDQQTLREWLFARDGARKPVLQKLRSLAGAAKNLPADLAANHDHYLHGVAKRS